MSTGSGRPDEGEDPPDVTKLRLECAHCRREVQPDWQFCAHCDARLATACPNCGVPLPPAGATHCGHCGMILLAQR